MDEDTPALEETMNKTFASKVTVTTSYLKTKPSDYEICVSKYGEDSIQCSILASVDTTGKCAEVEEGGTVNLNKNYENEEVNEGNVQTIMTDLIESEEGYVCSAPDDYGNSYYYRGAVENNWVKFADSYWRIIRVNGDGSIRLLYNGEASVIDALGEDVKAQVLSNGYDDSSTNYTTIGESKFNSSYDDNAYVGYMYGNLTDGIVEILAGTVSVNDITSTMYYADSYEYDSDTNTFTLNNPIELVPSEINEDFIGKYLSATTPEEEIYKITSVSTDQEAGNITFGISAIAYKENVSTSKEQAQENINDSTIKEYIDNWYEGKFLKTKYESYLSDTLFCNDRSLIKNETFKVDEFGTFTQLGYGLEKTAYRGIGDYGFFMAASVKPSATDYNQLTINPTLQCKQKNDRFTVNDEKVGNGALTYPVSLITVDEIYLAGGSTFIPNDGYYLYNGDDYWTLSPFFFAGMRNVGVNGITAVSTLDYSFGVRPVLNLKAGSLKMGSGTVLDPYLVE